MNVLFYYCTPNDQISLLQYHPLQPHWSLHELLIFLRCILLNYQIIDEVIRNTDCKYFIVYDEQAGPIFRIYFYKNYFEIAILQHITKLTTSIICEDGYYFQYAQLYKKASSKNFKICLYQVQFFLLILQL